jgi:hypothetical protein
MDRQAMPKASPLAKLETLDGVDYVFNPELVIALYSVNQVLPSLKTGRRAVHVWGIAARPLPIAGSAETFLADLKITDDFVSLTSANGKLYVRADGISFILAHEPGVDDPKIKSSLHFADDPLLKFYAYEDVATVKRLVDAIRTRADCDVPAKLTT